MDPSQQTERCTENDGGQSSLEAGASRPATHHESECRPSWTEQQKQEVRDELERISDSPAFRASPRSRDFLRFIVEQVLQGKEECLKERAIGTEVFHRPADYLTGDDPVVRVAAREVRRRLTRYYAESDAAEPPVRIDLPVGSYKPDFRWPPVEGETNSTTETVATASDVDPASGDPLPNTVNATVPPRRTMHRWWVPAACGLLLVLSAWLWHAQSLRSRPTDSQKFWQPMLNASQPVLVCMASPVVYQPSLPLYQRYKGANQSRYATELDRIHDPLDLPPNTPMRWSDMQSFPNFYVANGDAYSAARFSALFATLKKPSELHIGNGCSYQDLRYNPAILVGAFNNRWTLQFTSHLPFRFEEQDNQGRVEATADPEKQRWTQHWDDQGRLDRDYAVISRLFDSTTGQMVIIVAGIGPEGTQAASDLITSPNQLQDALRSAPSGWEKDDLQLVIQAPIADDLPGRSQVVAAKYWPAR